MDLYNVTQGGWYAVDDEDKDKAVLGPFESLGAIRDRASLVAPLPQFGSSPAHIP